MVQELGRSPTECIPIMSFLDITDHVPPVPESREKSGRAPPPLSASIDLDRSSETSASLPSLQGHDFLKYLALEISSLNVSKLVVPIAVIRLPLESNVSEPPYYNSSEHITSAVQPRHGYTHTLSAGQEAARANTESANISSQALEVNGRDMMKYMKAGAADVVPSPFHVDRIKALATHGYRVHLEASRNNRPTLDPKHIRKRSWCGVDDHKPYAYLRESMYVSAPCVNLLCLSCHVPCLYHDLINMACVVGANFLLFFFKEFDTLCPLGSSFLVFLSW